MLNPAKQILNFCCSLYLLQQLNNNTNSSIIGSAKSSLNSTLKYNNSSPTIRPNKYYCKRSLERITNLLSNSNNSLTIESINSKDLECIPKVDSCCELEIVGVEYDIRNIGHYIYQLKKSHSASSSSSFELADIQVDRNDIIKTINFSFIDFRDVWYVKEPWEIAVKTSATIPFVIIGIVGNACVICVILKAKLIRASIINLFILNMSIADFLFSLICPWIFLVYDLHQRWELGKFLCKYEGFILETLMLTSVLTLTTISIDRLTAIVYPFKKRLSLRVGKLVIYGIWISSAVISTPLVIWRDYYERQWQNFYEVFCTEDRGRLLPYWILLIAICVWLPLGSLIISYTAIITKLGSILNKRRGNADPSLHTTTAAAIPSHQTKSKAKVIQMFFIVLLVFTICWIPYTIMIHLRNERTVKNTSTPIPEWFEDWVFVAHYLMFINSAMNPIIYGLMNENIKRGFRQVAPSCLKKQFKMEVSTVYANKSPQQGIGQQFGQIKPEIKIQEASNANDFKSTRKKRKYYENLLFSTSDSNPSLSSFQRNLTAYADLGLPLPGTLNPVNIDTTTTTTGTGTASQF